MYVQNEILPQRTPPPPFSREVGMNREFFLVDYNGSDWDEEGERKLLISINIVSPEKAVANSEVSLCMSFATFISLYQMALILPAETVG